MNEADFMMPPSSPDILEWLKLARAARAEEESDSAPLEGARELKILVVRSEEAAYGLSVERVREIVRMRGLAPVPRSPDWLVGVVPLRGEMVEVVDLRNRLGGAFYEITRRSRIVVLNSGEGQVAGLLVDSIDEVQSILEEELLVAPESDSGMIANMIAGPDEFVSMLDLDRVLEISDD